MTIRLVAWLAGIACALTPALAQDPKPPKPPEKLSADELKQAKELYKAYFAAKTDADRATACAALEPLDHPSTADVTTFAKLAFGLAMAGPRVEGSGNVTCTDPAYPGKYILAGGGGGKRGIFICLHGGGQGVGDGEQIRSLFGAPGGGGMIHVYPTVIEKVGSAWNEEREERYVLAILDELKRTFDIDTNRVYLAGHSMGGYGTWSIGTRHADLFAAISPQAGGLFMMGGDSIVPGLVENLKNCPIWFYNSTDDKQVSCRSAQIASKQLEALKAKYGPFDYVWKEYSDIGHGTPKEGLAPIWKWMSEKRRDPLPKRVLWHSMRDYKRHFYWLARTDAAGPFDVARDGNTFTVTGASRGLAILLNKKMVRYDQDVIVKSDSGAELFKGRVRPSLRATLESIAAKRDLEMWFDAWIVLP